MRPKAVKDSAVALRKQGYSYDLIARKTGVSKSTLHYWLAKIPYQPNQEVVERIGKARAKSGEVKHKNKLATFAKAQAIARKEIGHISDRDIFMLGLGLYIGEGSKTQDHTRLVNSDPAVIAFFVRWLKKLGLADENIVMRLHCYPNTDLIAAEKFWLEVTGLSKSQLQKATIDRRKDKNLNREGKHPHCTLHVSVRANGKKEYGVLLARKIQAYSELVLS